MLIGYSQCILPKSNKVTTFNLVQAWALRSDETKTGKKKSVSKKKRKKCFWSSFPVDKCWYQLILVINRECFSARSRW